MNEPIEERLRTIARARIASGELPRVTASKMWAGTGTKQRCALCDTPIQPDLVEYEVEATIDGTSHTLFFHRICQSVWQLEVARAGYPDYLRTRSSP